MIDSWLLFQELNATGKWHDANRRLWAERHADAETMREDDLMSDEAFDACAESGVFGIPSARDAALGIAEMRNGCAYCYFAFFGSGSIAKYVKIGISNHPELRMQSIKTGNPLDLVAVYARKFLARSDAMWAEQTILRAPIFNRKNGEWIEIEPSGAAEIDAVAKSLAATIPMLLANGDIFHKLTVE